MGANRTTALWRATTLSIDPLPTPGTARRTLHLLAERPSGPCPPPEAAPRWPQIGRKMTLSSPVPYWPPSHFHQRKVQRQVYWYSLDLRPHCECDPCPEPEHAFHLKKLYGHTSGQHKGAREAIISGFVPYSHHLISRYVTGPRTRELGMQHLFLDSYPILSSTSPDFTLRDGAELKRELGRHLFLDSYPTLIT